MQRDYGRITGYQAPRERHPGSIMALSSTSGHGRGGQEGPRIIGDVINHGKHERWGKQVRCAGVGAGGAGAGPPKQLRWSVLRAGLLLATPLPAACDARTSSCCLPPRDTWYPTAHAMHYTPRCHAATLPLLQGVHYHEGMRAGENTLNALCARVVMRGMAQRGAYSTDGFLAE